MLIQNQSNIFSATMSTISDSEDRPPIFKAVSGSARQLVQLLSCIRFAPKAQVQISKEGLRFAVEEARVMQGWYYHLISMAFW